MDSRILTKALTKPMGRFERLSRLRQRRAASAPKPKPMNNIDETRESLRKGLRFAGSSADETVAEALARAIEAFVDAKLERCARGD